MNRLTVHAVALAGMLSLTGFGLRSAHAQVVYQAPPPVYAQAPRTRVPMFRPPWRAAAPTYYAPGRPYATNPARVVGRRRTVWRASDAEVYNWPNGSPVMIAKPWLNP